MTVGGWPLTGNLHIGDDHSFAFRSCFAGVSATGMSSGHLAPNSRPERAAGDSQAGSKRMSAVRVYFQVAVSDCSLTVSFGC
jgi:hypothetical protein